MKKEKKKKREDGDMSLNKNLKLKEERKMFLKVKELAEILKISQKSVYEMVARNKVPHFRFGNGRGVIRFDEKQIVRWIKRRTRKDEKL